jgi:hypothetical protein
VLVGEGNANNRIRNGTVCRMRIRPTWTIPDGRDNEIGEQGLDSLLSVLRNRTAMSVVAFGGSGVSSISLQFAIRSRRGPWQTKRCRYSDAPPKALDVQCATHNEMVDLKGLFVDMTSALEKAIHEP